MSKRQDNLDPPTGCHHSFSRVVLLLLLVGCVVRSIGLEFGLPTAVARPDEEIIVQTVLQMEVAPGWNPKFFAYPSLLFYVSYGCYQAWLCGERFAGATEVTTINALFLENPAPFHLILRVISVACGTLTILMVCLAARRLYGRRTALLAGLFICFCYLHVRESHFGVTDVPCVFLAAASFWQLTEFYVRGRFRFLLVASILAGLAIGTKYTAAWMGIPFTVVLIGRTLRQPGDGRWFYGLTRSLVAAAVTVATFFCTTPYFFLDFDFAWMDFSWEMMLLGDRNTAITATYNYWDYFRIALWYGLGWPVLLSALAGGVWMARRRDARGLLLWFLPIAYFLFVGRGGRYFIRYMDIVLPFLAIIAAWAVRSAWLTWRYRHPVWRSPQRRWRRAPALAFVLLLLAPSILRIVAFDRIIARPDSRGELRAWMLANIATEEPILLSGGWASLPYMIHHAPIRPIMGTERVQAELLRHPDALYGYRWIVLVDWPRVYYSGGHNAEERAFLAKMMAGRYALVHSIDTYKGDLPPDLFCALDHFFMSYQQPWILDRPGPGFRVYRRVD